MKKWNELPHAMQNQQVEFSSDDSMALQKFCFYDTSSKKVVYRGFGIANAPLFYIFPAKTLCLFTSKPG